MSTAATCEGVVRALALETSGRVGSVAAFHSARGQAAIIATCALPPGQRSAQSLVPAIAELLKECHWHARDLQLICVTTGPGSFTGLRIGVTTAKTLAYASGAQLVGIHTLAALAAAVATDSHRTWAILDAQRQELFAANFQQGRASETQVLSQDEWLALLQPGDLVTGPSLDKLSARLPAGVIPADRQWWQPSAHLVARLGAESHARGETIDPMQLTPHYYRLSAAEEKAAAK